jgi:amidophosphoribosyltransferase
MSDVEHSCGVIGFAGKSNVAPLIYAGLYALQHRGQEAAGITVWNENSKSFISSFGEGLVRDAFTSKQLGRLNGETGIGHVRYSTYGSKGLKNVQPLKAKVKKETIILAHNGEITNKTSIRRFLMREGISPRGDTDSELIALLLAHLCRTEVEIEKAIAELMRKVSGAYSLVFIRNGELFACRDPRGIRPLCIGKADGLFGAASESVGFDSINGTFLRDVEPGELVRINSDRAESIYKSPANRSFCMFEFVYFARGDSVLEGKSIQEVRERLGRNLARDSPVKADIVVPIPDSGRSHALGFSRESGIPYAEGLMKNRYIPRTFIMPEQAKRVFGVKIKLNPVKRLVGGKRIVLVDDSLVRGTTMANLIKILRWAGASEVHVRISCSPVIAPCYFGINMKTKRQLPAAKKSVEEIKEMIGADSLKYNSINSLIDGIGIPEKDLCLGCITGKYPSSK